MGICVKLKHNKEARQHHGPWVGNNMLLGMRGKAVNLEVDRSPLGPRVLFRRRCGHLGPWLLGVAWGGLNLPTQSGVVWTHL